MFIFERIHDPVKFRNLKTWSMKKLMIVFLLSLLSIAAWGQNVGGDVVKRAGTHLKVNGEKLSREAQAALLANVGGVDYNAAWDKAKAGRNAGMGLAIGGGVTALAGGFVLIIGATTSVLGAATGAVVGSIGGQETAQQAAGEGAKAGEPLMTGGLIAAAVGAGAVVASIPMLIVNCKKLNQIAGACNAGKPIAQVSLGPTANGVGISVRF